MISGGLLLNTVISVQRRSSAKDSSGGQAAGGAYVSVPEMTNLPALVQPTRGKAMRATGQRQVFLTHQIYLDEYAPIARGDRIHHPATSRYFTVHGFEDMGGVGRVWRIECTEET